MNKYINEEYENCFFKKYSRNDLIEAAKTFYEKRDYKDFTSREWDKWEEKPMTSQGVANRFGGFAQFKICADIKTSSVIKNITPQQATEHLLTMMKVTENVAVSRNSLEQYNKSTGVNIGHGYYEKFWGSLKNQVDRYKLYLKKEMEYEELIKTSIKE